jgi:acetyltransferase-like isoleucine patch superfamily enzyme
MPNYISPSAHISLHADIEESVRGSILSIGEHCIIDSFVKIKFAGGKADITIGDQCYFNSGCVLYSGNGITIGTKVLVAANCTFAPTNHGVWRERTMLEQPFMKSKGGILIEDDVWIGANSVILDGAVLRKGCVIAAGSVVRGECNAYCIYAGNPLVLKGVRPTQNNLP